MSTSGQKARPSEEKWAFLSDLGKRSVGGDLFSKSVEIVGVVDTDIAVVSSAHGNGLRG
jgi:hypothetical protein